MYFDDSFFTLSGPGQIGLILISFVLFIAVINAVNSVGRTLPRPAALGLAIVGFWAFEWLSPQIYYFYYLTQFDGLPIQSVIQTPPSPAKLLRIITFQDDKTLSAHGRAVLGWALVVAALGPRRIRKPPIHCDEN